MLNNKKIKNKKRYFSNNKKNNVFILFKIKGRGNNV